MIVYENREATTFENIIRRLFEILNYKVELERLVDSRVVDLIATNETEKIFVEIKFYRSQRISTKVLKGSANELAYYLKVHRGAVGLLIVNAIVPDQLKSEILDEFGINIWDKQALYNLLTRHSITIRDEFEQLLVSVQQGNDTYDVFSDIHTEKTLDQERKLIRTDAKPESLPEKKGKRLKVELDSIRCGKSDWSKYEIKCLEILQYLFNDDLQLWDKQSRADDGLSRFDLICRIASTDDYWKALVSSFNTRFVLFEFKNYCDPIDQGQIYTTERYLYLKGLRSVGFIIARNGANPNAIAAAKGALREHGKLILILTNEDLHKMLELKDNNEIPNDYLSGLLDKWLVSLSR